MLPWGAIVNGPSVERTPPRGSYMTAVAVRDVVVDPLVTEQNAKPVDRLNPGNAGVVSTKATATSAMVSTKRTARVSFNRAMVQVLLPFVVGARADEGNIPARPGGAPRRVPHLTGLAAGTSDFTGFAMGGVGAGRGGGLSRFRRIS